MLLDDESDTSRRFYFFGVNVDIILFNQSFTKKRSPAMVSVKKLHKSTNKSAKIEN